MERTGERSGQVGSIKEESQLSRYTHAIAGGRSGHGKKIPLYMHAIAGGRDMRKIYFCLYFLLVLYYIIILLFLSNQIIFTSLRNKSLFLPKVFQFEGNRSR